MKSKVISRKERMEGHSGGGVVIFFLCLWGAPAKRE